MTTIPSPSELLDLTGRVVIVTGAGGTIGAGIAARVAAAGATVAAQTRTSPVAVDDLRRAGNAGHTEHRVDLTAADGPGTLIDDVLAAHGRIDGLVNNAGIQPIAALADLADDDWREMLDTNVTALHRLTQAAAAVMVAAGGGSIVHIASIEGSQPAPLHEHYSVSKAAVIMHGRAAASAYGRSGGTGQRDLARADRSGRHRGGVAAGGGPVASGGPTRTARHRGRRRRRLRVPPVRSQSMDHRGRARRRRWGAHQADLVATSTRPPRQPSVTTMWIRLRQIAVVASDLREVGLDIGTVLGVEPCFTDPGVKRFGLKNMLWPIGTQFLEVVTPIEDGTAGGRYIERRGGDMGYMFITQVDDVAHRRARAGELGVRIALELSHPDAGHDGIQLHPRDTGGTFFEMDQMTMAGGDEVGGPWHPAGPNWEPYVRTDVVTGIAGAEIQSPEPEPLARRWADIAELELGTDEHGHPRIELDNAVLRFVEDRDGRGEGLGGIDVTTADREAVLAGARARDCYVSDDEVLVAGLRVYLH